jgi:hypothetical protein
MAFETAMTGALAPKQSSRCTNVKLCDRVPGTIAIALLSIGLVKANKNQNSYGNAIDLNFYSRSELNLKNDFKHICLSAISCADMKMFVYMRLP